MPWLKTAFSGVIWAYYTTKHADLSILDADGIERGVWSWDLPRTLEPVDRDVERDPAGQQAEQIVGHTGGER